MAKRRIRHRTSGKRRTSHRRTSRGGFGGGRWGVNITDTGISAVAGAVGGAIQSSIVNKWPAAPEFIKLASVESLGLYVLGVVFNRPDYRSIGAGLALGKWAGIGITSAVNP